MFRTQRIFGLDVLRAAAIAGVLVAHIQLLLPYDVVQRASLFREISGHMGTWGVELFFVLSGFLIGSILLKQSANFGQLSTLATFWYRRWMRTLPNYWLFLGLAIAVGLVSSASLPSLWPYLIFSQNLAWSHPPFFGEAWSLAVEEWFYFAFPLGILLTMRAVKSFDRAFITMLITFVAVPTLFRVIIALTTDLGWNHDIRRIVALRLDAIMYGVLAAWLKTKYEAIWQRWRLPMLAGGILTIGLMILLFSKGSFFDKTFLFSFIGLGFSMCLPFADQWELRTETRLSTAVRNLALWSYSLYLCNLLVVAFIRYLRTILPLVNGWGVDVVSISIYLALSLGTSALVYRFYEKPITALRDRHPRAWQFLPDKPSNVI